jgi:hypothetical protein
MRGPSLVSAIVTPDPPQRGQSFLSLAMIVSFHCSGR